MRIRLFLILSMVAIYVDARSNNAITGVKIPHAHNISSLWLALAVALFAGTALPISVAAQSEGLYVSGALGAVWPQDAEFAGRSFSSEAGLDPSVFGSIALGTTIGENWRGDAELSHRTVDVNSISGALNGSGEISGSAAMLNGYYDLFSGSNWRPYIGGGIGLMHLSTEGIAPIGGSTIDDEDMVVAVQGIAGIGYRVNDSLGLFTDYRFLAATDPGYTTTAGQSADGEYSEHRIVFGLRWSFGGLETARKAPVTTFMEPKATAKKRLDMPWSPEDRPRALPAIRNPLVPAKKPTPTPPKQVAQTPKLDKATVAGQRFLVYFEWDRWAVTRKARLVIRSAGEAGTGGRETQIHAIGHADRSGPARYNMMLSQRRAEAVKAELVKLGVSAGAITLEWKGEAVPVVQTADGVREAENRRVEILIK